MTGFNSSHVPAQDVEASGRYLPLSVSSFILATGATVGNVLLLTAIYRNPYRNLRTNSSLLVTNLALSDFMVGMIAGYGMFSYEVSLYLGNALHGYMVDILVVCSSVPVVCGVCTVVIMAIDRYLAVISPFSYAAKVTKPRVKIALGIIWTYTLAVNSLFLVVLPENLGCFLSSHLHITVPACILSLAYFKMLLVVRKQNKQWKTGTKHGLRIRPLSLRCIALRERKLTSAIMLIMLCFLVSFLPLYLALNLLYLWKEHHRSWRFQTYLDVSLLIVISNSFLNPMIYALRVPKYRKAFKHTLGARDNVVNVLMSALVTLNVHARTN